jgi:cobalt-zinc-cadmium efflux system outer membrane protein
MIALSMRSIIFIFLILSSRNSFADLLEPKLFLEQVLKSHPVLSATSQEIESAQAELLSNQGSFDPSLKFDFLGYPKGGYSGQYSNLYVEQPLEFYGSKLTAGYRQGNGAFPVYEDYYKTNSDGEARAGIEIPLLRDGKIDRRRASIQRAFQQIEGAKLSFRQKQVELAKAAALSYWEWVSSHAKLGAYKNLLETARKRNKQLVERVRAGDIAEFERIDNQRQVLQREGQLIAAERQFTKAQNDLSLFFWISVTEQGQINLLNPPILKIIPDHYLPNASDEVSTTALRQRVEHQRIENQLEQQKIELNLAKNQYLPKLDLQAYASNDYGTGSATKDEAEIKAGVKLEIPLAYRSQTGKLQMIEAKQRELGLQKRLVEQRIGVEVIDSLNALKMAISRARVAKDEVEIAKKLEVGEQSKFEQGESNLIFVNLREQATVDAVVREIEAIADCWKGFIVYRSVLGTVDFYQ